MDHAAKGITLRLANASDEPALHALIEFNTQR